ncbi:MAG: response regulator transcription factor [Chloroflexi bacterium]|nr:response regulator transcription factor [Chloroflexota bacterium]
MSGPDGPGTSGVSDATPGGGPRLGILLAIFDFPALVAGYRAVIEAQPDMRVVGVVDDRASLREQAARTPADIVISECVPGSGSGCASFEAIEAIRAAAPGTRILAVECRCASEQFSRALRAGADGYLTREAAVGDVVEAIHRLARGETYVSPAIVTRMVDTYVRRTPEATADDVYDALSERSREVLRLAAYGHTNREIALALNLSEQTVHSHRAAIMAKLGFRDRVELLRYALRRGVIQAAEL